MKIIDEKEAVCEDCGSIYDIEKLIFKHTNYSDTIDIRSIKGSKKCIKEIKDRNELTSTYECPICNTEISLEDRRKSVKNLL